MFRDDNGDNMKADTKVYIYGDAGVVLDSQLTVNSVVRVIYGVDTVTDETGNVHHQVVYCGGSR